jgi:tetratricopeptide (TPR) repeat protein
MSMEKTRLLLSRYGPAAAAVIAAALSFLVFLPALGCDFIYWDDNFMIVDNPRLKSLDFAFLKWAFTSLILSTWIPLSLVSLAVDYALWGAGPWGFHLTNNLLHSANTALVFFLVFRLVKIGSARDAQGALDKRAFVAALVTALLFGLHPLRVESVVWTTQRKDVLYALFYLLSVLLYLRYASSTTNKPATNKAATNKAAKKRAAKKRAWRYAGVLVLFACSLMSKPMAVTLPAVLLVLDYYPLNRFGPGRPAGPERAWKGAGRLVLEKVPFFALALLVAMATSMHSYSNDYLGERFIGIKLNEPYVFRTSLNVFYGYLFSLYKTFVPLDLAPLYPNFPKSTVFSVKLMVYPLLFSAITLCAVLSVKKRPVFSAAWFYYLVSLAPVVWFLASADRFSYLSGLAPLVLIELLAGAPFEGPVNKRLQIITVVTVVIVSAALAALTVKQTGVWRDSLTLWNHQIRLYPDRERRAYTNRGVTHLRAERYEEALEDHTKAIKLSPRRPGPFYNRGSTYMGKSRYEEAARDFTSAIERNPRFVPAYYLRGTARLGLRRFGDAVEDFSKTIRLNPRHAKAYDKRGAVYMSLGRLDEAVADFSNAIAVDPLFKDAYISRGRANIARGEFAAAVEDYTSVIAMEPGDARSYNNRGAARMELGEPEAALNDFERAIELDPLYADAYLNRGGVLERLGRLDEAIDEFEKVVRMDPENAIAYYNLAVARFGRGERGLAVEALKKAAALGYAPAGALLGSEFAR